MTTQEFIAQHVADDIRKLALQASRYKDIDMKFALTQIAALQIAARKLPSWSNISGIVWPERLPMEQCSSEATAMIKKAIVERLMAKEARQSMIDLTGGLGVDFSFIAPLFKEATYVDFNADLCRIAENNFKLLNLTHATVVNSKAEDFLATMPPYTLLYIDPARRLSSGGRAFAIADCTPDIEQLLPQLMAKCQYMIAKLSPMLDLTAVERSLSPYLRELHVVESEGECKELLAVCCSKVSDSAPLVVCHTPQEEVSFPIDVSRKDSAYILANDGYRHFNYFYIPFKSLAKASAMSWISYRFNLGMIARDSHIFMSTDPERGFPGRCFRLTGVMDFGSPVLKTVMKETKKANVAVRNFPLSAEQLRRKLRLSDGGDLYIFGTTAANGSHILLFGERYHAAEEH